MASQPLDDGTISLTKKRIPFEKKAPLSLFPAAASKLVSLKPTLRNAVFLLIRAMYV